MQQHNILIESRLTRLETLVEKNNEQLNRLERHSEIIENRMDARCKHMEETVSRIDTKLNQFFIWIVGLVVLSLMFPYVNIVLHAQGII